MKVIKDIKFKTKASLYKTFNKQKILPFFHVYQRMVRCNLITPFIYIFILILEYLQLLFELLNDGIDYISINNSNPIRQSSSYYIFYVLQYINFSWFINNTHFSYQQFIILYSITICFLLFNFVLLLIIDCIDKKLSDSNNYNSTTLKVFHIFLGIFNLLNVKYLIIPVHYILFKSYNIETFGTSSYVFDIVIIRIITSVILCINIYTLILTSLLYNDINPINSNICWGQSYPQIEVFNITLKIMLIICNTIDHPHFYFAKGIFALIINVFRCWYRYKEWYYSWNVNRVLLIVMDFCLLCFNFLSFVNDKKHTIDIFILYLVISLLIGWICYLIINALQRRILIKETYEFTSEVEFCRLIMYLVDIIKNLQNEKKSINDELFFGFLVSHSKYCLNSHCTAKIIRDIIYNNESTFSNEIDNFVITKSDFISYCKTSDTNDNFDMLQDMTKTHCDKMFYYLIKCIIDTAMKILPQHNPKLIFLPLIDSYIYTEIFRNNFYAMFEIMRHYKTECSHREKFFFFEALALVKETMLDEKNGKYTSMSQLSFVTDFYYYHEKFISSLYELLNKAKQLFMKLYMMLPTSKEVLIQSVSVGIEIKSLHKHYLKLMAMNPYEINTLRVYGFVIETLYGMKLLTKQYMLRLLQNIKYFLMNDKFKNTNATSNGNKNDSYLESKINIKNFTENSDTAVIIISGLINNLGDILYCNEMVTAIFGYNKDELIGFSVNQLIPSPVSNHHNDMVLKFYSKGKRSAVDSLRNRFGLHKNGFLICLNLYVCFFPSLEHGIMFIAMVRQAYQFSLVSMKEESIIVSKALSNANDTINKDDIDDKKEQSVSKTSKHSSIVIAHTFNDGKEQKDNEYNTNNDEDISNNTQKGTFLYQTKDTAVILINESFDIIHMNSIALVNLFGLSKNIPHNRVINMKKICHDFPKAFEHMKKGETANIVIDTESIVSKLINDNNVSIYGNNNYIGTGSLSGIGLDNGDVSHTNTNKLLFSPIITTRSKTFTKLAIKNNPNSNNVNVSMNGIGARNVKAALAIYYYYDTKNNSLTKNKSQLNKKYYYLLAIQTNSSKDTSNAFSQGNNTEEDEYDESENEITYDEDDNIMIITDNNMNNTSLSAQSHINTITNEYYTTDNNNNNNNNNAEIKENNFIHSSIDPNTKRKQRHKRKAEKNKLNERTKKHLLNDTYMSHFTRAANITLYLLILVTIIWLITSYIIEFTRLKSIKNLLKAFNRNEHLINIISSYIIETYLILRINYFHSKNETTSLTHLKDLVIETLSTEQKSLYELQADNYKDEVSYLRKHLLYEPFEISIINENKTLTQLSFSLSKALDKLIFAISFLKQETPYTNVSQNKFFGINIPLHELKIKMHTVFYNFYSAYYSHLISFSQYIETKLNDNIKNSKHKMLVVFGISFAFCSVISFLFVLTMINQEQKKKDFLKYLSEKHDDYYEDKVSLINTFINSFKVMLIEEHNLHKIKHLLDKDDEFKNDFIQGDAFLLKKQNDFYKENFIPSFGKKVTEFTEGGSYHRKDSNITGYHSKSKMKSQKDESYEDEEKRSDISAVVKTDNESEGTIVDTLEHEKEILNENIQQQQVVKPKLQKQKRNSISVWNKILKKNTKVKDNITTNNNNEVNSSLVQQSTTGNQKKKLSKLDTLTAQQMNFFNTHHFTKTFTSNHNEESSNLTSHSSNNTLRQNTSSSSSNSDYSEKSYAKYSIPYKQSIINFIFVTIYLSSFYIISISLLYVYYPHMDQIVSVLLMLWNRSKFLNNILITQNFNLVFNYSLNINESFTIANLTNTLQIIEDEYKNILTKLKRNKKVNNKILRYESESACDEYAQHEMELPCQVYMNNKGISFKISEILHYVYEMNIVLKHKLKMKELNINEVENAFKDKMLIQYMVSDLFFLRGMNLDILDTYIDDYEDYFKMINIVFHVKFCVYFILVVMSIGLYQGCFLPKIVEIINNLTRVKLFF